MPLPLHLLAPTEKIKDALNIISDKNNNWITQSLKTYFSLPPKQEMISIDLSSLKQSWKPTSCSRKQELPFEMGSRKIQPNHD